MFKQSLFVIENLFRLWCSICLSSPLNYLLLLWLMFNENIICFHVWFDKFLLPPSFEITKLSTIFKAIKHFLCIIIKFLGLKLIRKCRKVRFVRDKPFYFASDRLVYRSLKITCFWKWSCQKRRKWNHFCKLKAIQIIKLTVSIMVPLESSTKVCGFARFEIIP